mgnify:CR=1 FL=1
MRSVNNKLLLTPYASKGKIEANIKSGFATVKQKDTLVGLVAVADGQVLLGQNNLVVVKKGDTVFFPEEILHSHDWAKKTFNLEGSTERFIIAESVHAVAVKHAD